MAPKEFIANDDWKNILRDEDEIAEEEAKLAEGEVGLAATPNEVAHGRAQPTNVTPNPDQPSDLESQQALAEAAA